MKIGEPVSIQSLLFWVCEGALPPGVHIDTQTGAISGVPTKAGTFTYVLCIEETRPGYWKREIAKQRYSLTVEAK